MAVFEYPSWAALDALASSAGDSLLLCAPFITRPALERVRDQVHPGVRVSIITSVSVDAWIAGVCDPEALVEFLVHFQIAEVHLSTRLHAKAVVADGRGGLVGSANLTRRAYTHNLELQAGLDEAETGQVIRLLDGWGASLRVLSTAELASWVAGHRDAVEQERRRLDEERPGPLDALGHAQQELDRLSGGRAIEQRPVREPSPGLLEDFVDWVEDHQDLPGAAEVVARHDNRHGANLTGHVKQSFFASYIFFQSDSDLIPAASQLLDGLRSEDIPQPDGELLEAWLEHVEGNAGMVSEPYSFPVLRSYLPPGLGGTRQGGGGGSSTLKRVMPLVARWLEDDR